MVQLALTYLLCSPTVQLQQSTLSSSKFYPFPEDNPLPLTAIHSTPYAGLPFGEVATAILQIAEEIYRNQPISHRRYVNKLGIVLIIYTPCKLTQIPQNYELLLSQLCLIMSSY